MSRTEKMDRRMMLRAGSWGMYDFANTIYSYIVVTMYLPPLLEKVTGNNFLMSFANVFSMVIAGLSAPVFGALTDRSAKAKRWLIITTIICCLMCVALGFLVSPGDSPGLMRCLTIGLAFVVANFTYQVGLVFYNSFLPTFQPASVQGKISGLGVALGYVGVLAMINPADWMSGIRPWLVFPFGGAMFLLFAMPMFITIPERKPLKEEPITKALVKKELRNLKRLIGRLRNEPNLRNAFLANFLAVDGVNTALLFFTTFLTNAVFHTLPEDAMKTATKNQMFALTVSAIVMSLAFGWLADRIGSKRSFLVATLSMVGASLCGCFLPRGWPFYITVTLFGGAGLAGVWTTGRKLFADIAPSGQEGDFFGLYGMANKSSALGTIIFACLTFFLPYFKIMDEPHAYRAAFLFAVVTLSGSLYFLRKVKIGKNETTDSTNSAESP